MARFEVVDKDGRVLRRLVRVGRDYVPPPGAVLRRVEAQLHPVPVGPPLPDRRRTAAAVGLAALVAVLILVALALSSPLLFTVGEHDAPAPNDAVPYAPDTGGAEWNQWRSQRVSP